MSSIKTGAFVRFFYHGIFHFECTVEKVDHHDPHRITVPSRAYAFQFFDVEMSFEDTRAASTSKETNLSRKYFIAGRVMTLEQLKQKYPNEQTLIANTVARGCSKVIVIEPLTFYPFDDSSCVLLSESR